MTPEEAFRQEVAVNVEGLRQDRALADLSREWVRATSLHRYSYNFRWLGRPIIQYPQDMVALQELIWAVRPDVVIETGVAHGGSLILSASLLALLDYCDAVERGDLGSVGATVRRVIGIDIEIRPHNRKAIEGHPLAHKIEIIEGSSVSADTVRRVQQAVGGAQRVMVLLDSNHTHDHVLSELRIYAPMVSVGSYCVVFDTVIEKMPPDLYPGRPWRSGNSPLSAVNAYLAEIGSARSQADHPPAPAFEVDHALDAKLMVTVAPGGYLRRIA